ncbi:MAG: N5-carboxyaminoimidazole ribonucleotide mutase [candidate division TA06 bacterium ADurb.Bin131]|uniref:N5-carboxyaminoimidazole ribonucleotide mutase n=1 Tax=candidate division TA06 bacterium ADurb.Bin131 TaxID=1852827 RepID=A0A1V6C5S9_UNCT6|nr:MAG: N5-carboxyaminoimidazole ribonucleotide mutase [candidate division TA06 bacterium ADurb.Bin131]
MQKPLVVIVFGSQNDLVFAEAAKEILEKFGVPYSVEVISAHRSLDKTIEFAETAEEKGIRVIIACAGMSAHLPGVVAAKTILPVIGVPLPTSEIKGVDSLYSMVQMPGGVPVGTMAIGKAGVKNAAIFAIEIISLSDDNLKKKLKEFKNSLK